MICRLFFCPFSSYKKYVKLCIIMKHLRDERVNKKHIAFYTFFRVPVIWFLKIRFGYRYEKAKNLPENYIVISNHVTDYDPLFLGASFPRQMYFVGSEHIARWGFIYKFLKFGFAPIMRSKGASAANAVIEMIKQVKAGANVCLFAEGVRTWDGVSNEVPKATAKLIKKANCGLVTYKITRGYFASPMWCGAKIRRGPVYGAPVHIYTKEDIQAMSIEELDAAINRDIYEDAYERQLENPKRYRGRNLAMHLENLMFICPNCGKKDTFKSEGNNVSCKLCNVTYVYDEYGMLQGAPVKTLKEFVRWQKAQVAKDVAAGVAYRAEYATLLEIKKHEEILAGEGRMLLSKEYLACGNVEIPMEEISDMAMHGQRALVFTAGKKYYEVIPEEGFNVLKFMEFYGEYKKQIKERG